MEGRFVSKARSRSSGRFTTTLGLAVLLFGVLITPVWAMALLWAAEEALSWLLANP